MKKLLLSFLGAGLMCLSSYAQSFEGQITYKIEVKGENAAMLSMMMPNSTDIFVLGKDVLVRNNGGMAAAKTGDIITKGDEGVTYMVVHSKKTVYKMGSDKDKKSESKPTIEVLGKETVNGYNCTKYLVKFPKTEKGEIYQYMWCTTDVKFNKPANASSQLLLKDVDGLPVKTDMYITVSAMGTTMSINQEMTLDKISEVKPDAAMFEIPKKYKMEDFDETKMGQ